MHHWTNRRKASLIIHTIVVLIPLTFSTAAALFFWKGLFQSWLIAIPLVLAIDILSLLGLALFIGRVASPFQALRHVLPFVSVVPLGYEMWLALAPHNDMWIAASVAVVVTAILVAIAQRCYVTIERLFVDPVVAAREYAQDRMQHIATELAQVQELNSIVDQFVSDRLAYHGVSLRHDDAPDVRHDAPQLTHDDTDDAPFSLEALLNLAPPDTAAPLDDAARLDLARRLRQQGKPWRTVAREVGVSDATLRRKLLKEG